MTEKGGPGERQTSHAWRVHVFPRNIVLSLGNSGLEIDLPANGWGAFLVKMPPKVFSVFVSGKIVSREPSVWPKREDAKAEEAHGPHSVLYYSINRTLDGWTLQNSLSGATLALEHGTGEFRLVDRFGRTRLDAASLRLKLESHFADSEAAEPLRPAPTPLPEPEIEFQPSPEDLPVAEPPSEESASGVDLFPPVIPEEAAPFEEASPTDGGLLEGHQEQDSPIPRSGTTLLVESQANGTFQVELPFVLTDKETNIFLHIARYGSANNKDLVNVVKSRAATTASKLVDRLHEAGVPYIRTTEGQIYEFNYSH